MAGEFYFPFKGHVDEVAVELNETALEEFLNSRQFFDLYIGDMADVDLLPPANIGDVLVFDGTNWLPGDHGDVAGLFDDDHPQYLLVLHYQNSLAEDWDTDMDTTPPVIGYHLEFTGNQSSVLSRTLWTMTGSPHSGANVPQNMVSGGTGAFYQASANLGAAESFIQCDAGALVTANEIRLTSSVGDRYANTVTLFHSDDNVTFFQTALQFTGLGPGTQVLNLLQTNSR